MQFWVILGPSPLLLKPVRNLPWLDLLQKQVALILCSCVPDCAGSGLPSSDGTHECLHRPYLFNLFLLFGTIWTWDLQQKIGEGPLPKQGRDCTLVCLFFYRITDEGNKFVKEISWSEAVPEGCTKEGIAAPSHQSSPLLPMICLEIYHQAVSFSWANPYWIDGQREPCWGLYGGS